MKQFLIILRSIIYVPLFILLFGWLATYVRVFDPEIGIVLPIWTITTGRILMAAGDILVLTCVTVFVFRGKGTPAIFDPPTVFVVTGPYAYVRNPMYIGGFVLLTGFGLYHTSMAILIFAIVMLFLFHLFVVYVEETALSNLFGDSYLDYKKHINRWIPNGKRYLRKK